MTELVGHKKLVTTQDKIGQSCTLFSKARVCQSLLKMPNAVYPLVFLSHQVWFQSPLIRAVGTWGFWSMHSQSFEYQKIIKV